jgi:TonB family protein
MRLISFLFLFSALNFSFAQNTNQDPEFPGGQTELTNYLLTNIIYPQDAQDNNIEGTVFVSFTVGIDGALSNIQIVKGVHQSLDTEASRVIDEMPNWNPGLSNGQAVAIDMRMPIKFQLNN